MRRAEQMQWRPGELSRPHLNSGILFRKAPGRRLSVKEFYSQSILW